MHASNYLQDNEPIVRGMELGDILAVFLIEERCHDFDAWPEKLFEDCLLAGFPSFVIEKRGIICGFVMCSLGADEMQILNIKIDPDFRNKGLASKLLTCCLELAKDKRCYKVLLEVRVSNFTAQHLYESFTFIQDGCRKDYYSAAYGLREDALLYSLELRKY